MLAGPCRCILLIRICVRPSIPRTACIAADVLRNGEVLLQVGLGGKPEFADLTRIGLVTRQRQFGFPAPWDRSLSILCCWDHGHMLMGLAHEHMTMGLAHEHVHMLMGLAHEHMLRGPSQEAGKPNWRWRVTKPNLVRSANTGFPPNPIYLLVKIAKSNTSSHNF